ncbi:MAG: stage II sporulation protein E [Acidobacteriota bacterium]
MGQTCRKKKSPPILIITKNANGQEYNETGKVEEGGCDLDRPEIYPYQRVDEFGNTRRPSQKRKTWNFNLLVVGKPLLWQVFNRLLTPELIAVWVGSLIMGRAFILGEILPFAAAFTMAFMRRDRRFALGIPIFTIIGLLTIVEGYLLWGNIVAVLAISILLQYINVPDSRRFVALPALTVAIVVVAKTAFLLFNNPTVYREIVVIFESLIAGILTFVFMVARDVVLEGKRIKDFNFEDAAALVIMGIGLIAGLSDVQIFNLSITGIVCRFGILVAAYLWGLGAATVVGVGGGIIPAVSTITLPRTLAIYAVSGILAGIFRVFGRLGVILGFVLGNLALSIFIINGYQAVLSLWETAIAVCIFLLIPDTIWGQVPSAEKPAQTKSSAMVEHVKGYTTERMNNLARVFEEMSMTFADSDICTEEEEHPQASRLFEHLAESFCARCTLYRTCWDSEFYNTYSELFNVFSTGELKGNVEYEDISADFRRKCLRPRELATAINGVIEAARVNNYWEEKITESKGLLSHQLKGISGLIKGLAREMDLETVIDMDLKNELLGECRRLEIPVRDLTPIIGANNEVFIKVSGNSCLDRETCDILLAPSISTLMGTRYEVSQRKCPRTGWGSCEFTLAKAFSYRVVTGVSQLSMGEVCGDSFNIATLKDGRELVVLSDGMGIGRKASQESKATVSLLEELLNTGFGQEVALKTVNSILLLRNQNDSFATVDLVLINLYTGEAEFVKVGGTASFLKRDKLVGVIKSSSLPIGIIDDPEIPIERRSLMPGDMLVMVTDGVLDPGKNMQDGEVWMRRLLSETREKDPHRLAERIVNKALEVSKGVPKDDITAICCRIEPV